MINPGLARDAGAHYGTGEILYFDAHYYGAFVFDPDDNKIEALSYSTK